MSSRIITVEPFDLVVFGGAGDLAYRKLLPALFERDRDGQIPPLARIIGQVLEAGYDGCFDLELIGPAIESEGYSTAIPRAVDRLAALLASLDA